MALIKDLKRTNASTSGLLKAVVQLMTKSGGNTRVSYSGSDEKRYRIASLDFQKE
jgi:hypothetical protein